MGFTPSLVVGCWVGGDDRDIHFNTMQYGQGASAALPIYGLFMNKVYKDSKLGYSQDEKFDIPEDFELCSSELDNLEPGTDFVEDDEGSLYGDGEIDEFFQ